MEAAVERICGDALRAMLPEVARLRIEIFREYPYLYAGDEEAEEEYLKSYADAGRAVVVIAKVGGEVVGASTGLPLVDADPAFQAPFIAAGEEIGDWFYFGESVLKADFRGMGIGHRFFDHREVWARSLGFRKLAFCAVERPDDHPLRPAGHRALDKFWEKRGFVSRPGMLATLGWRQVDGGRSEVTNRLMFWTREEKAGGRQM